MGLVFWFSLTGFSSWCICIIYIECNCWYVWIKLYLVIIFLFVPLFLIPLFPLSCLPLYCMDVYYIILTIVFFTIFLCKVCFGGCSGNYSLHNFLQFYLEVIFYHLEKNIQILPPYPLSSPTLWCSCGLCIISINSHQAVLYVLLSTDIHSFENLRGKNSFSYLSKYLPFLFFHSWSSKVCSAIISLLPRKPSLAFLLKQTCLWGILLAFHHRQYLFLPLFLKDIFLGYKILGSGLTIL